MGLGSWGEGEGRVTRGGDGSVGEFHCEFSYQICNKYAEKSGAKAASFWETPENFYSFFFVDAGVQDSKCDIVEAGTEVVP